MTQTLLDAGPSERGWHRIETAARCLRLFAWTQVAGTTFPATEPLSKGSLLHRGLAHPYARAQAEQQGTDPDEFYGPHQAVKLLAEKNLKTATGKEIELWKSSQPTIHSALDAYIRRWREQDKAWEVVEVETQLKATVRSPITGKSFLFTQRPDLVVKDPHGFHWIVDHKSCYRIATKTLNQHILSGQFLGYTVFGRARWGNKFGGLVINRVKLSTPHGFDRSSVEPAPAAVTRFAKNLAMMEDRVAQFEGKPPMEWPAVYSDQVCYGKYGPCPCFELCQWGEE